MYETLKVVNGYEIRRMVGSQRCYHVILWEHDGWQKYCTFRTLKAAVQFCETLK